MAHTRQGSSAGTAARRTEAKGISSAYPPLCSHPGGRKHSSSAISTCNRPFGARAAKLTIMMPRGLSLSRCLPQLPALTSRAVSKAALHTSPPPTTALLRAAGTTARPARRLHCAYTASLPPSRRLSRLPSSLGRQAQGLQGGSGPQWPQHGALPDQTITARAEPLLALLASNPDLWHEKGVMVG